MDTNEYLKNVEKILLEERKLEEYFLKPNENDFGCSKDDMDTYRKERNSSKSEYNKNDLTKEELDEYIRKKSPLKLMINDEFISFISQNRDMVARQAGLIGYGSEIWGIIRDRHIDRLISNLKVKAKEGKNG